MRILLQMPQITEGEILHRREDTAWPPKGKLQAAYHLLSAFASKIILRSSINTCVVDICLDTSSTTDFEAEKEHELFLPCLMENSMSIRGHHTHIYKQQYGHALFAVPDIKCRNVPHVAHQITHASHRHCRSRTTSQIFSFGAGEHTSKGKRGGGDVG